MGRQLNDRSLQNRDRQKTMSWNLWGLIKDQRREEKNISCTMDQREYQNSWNDVVTKDI